MGLRGPRPPEGESWGGVVDEEAPFARVGRYGDLSGNLEDGWQANHINQVASFRDVIPLNDGLAVPMRGSAITDIGSAHYEFHAELENLWAPYR